MSLLNELAPIGGKREWIEIPVNRNGNTCVCCGRCCAIVGIAQPLRYFKEHIKKWIVWEKQNPLAASTQERHKWAREYELILKYWRRIPKREVIARGQKVYKEMFYYICRALKKEGDKYICTVHDKDKPYVCRGFPFYTSKKGPVKVLKGCSIAGG